MEQETAAVEHDLRHTRLFGGSGEALANVGSRRGGCAGLAADILVQRRSRSQCLTGGIIDKLGIDCLLYTSDAADE